ncbi:MAG: agmatine deiminase family protein [Parvularcula sp.]
MLRPIILFACALLAACGMSKSGDEKDPPTVMAASKELIVVAAPRSNDPYYKDVAADILAFHVAYARAAEGLDDFLVLTDEAAFPAYVEALGVDRVVIAPQDDIWMRDFSPSNTAAPMMFRYTAEGQGGGQAGQQEADHVQNGLTRLMEAASMRYGKIDLLNDGGNFVDDYAGRAVVSRKFLRDNKMNEAEAHTVLQVVTGLTHIAFIDADEQGGLEHADGVVAFIAPNVLVINSYPDDPAYVAMLKSDLRAGLPGVTIHNIVTPHDDRLVYDDRFGSACGLYTNMLVTPERIYMPQFGIPEDEVALASIQKWTSKEVVPVRTDGICAMGGGVRCMSWQLRGAHAEALKAFAAKQ